MKCVTCGKFTKIEIDCAWVYVPDSDLSFEEDGIQCKKCTTKHGRPIPKQSVNIDVCTGYIDNEYVEKIEILNLV